MEDDGEEGSAKPLTVDLSHLDSEIVEIAIEDLYAEDASARLEKRSKFFTCLTDHPLKLSSEYANPEERLNFAISVLSVANELMLDRLGAVCSSIIRPFSKQCIGTPISPVSDSKLSSQS